MKYNFKPILQYDAIDTGALIAGTSQIASSAINSMAANNLNKRAEQYNWEMYETQMKDNIALSDRQNNYNTPANQMNRLKQAGLNPNLIYGGAPNSNASAVSAPSALSWNPKAPDYSGIGTGIQTGLSVQLQQSQLKNQQAQNTVLEAQAANIAAQTEKTKAETPGASAQSGISSYNLQYLNDMKDVQQAQDKAQLIKTLNDVDISQGQLDLARQANSRAEQSQPLNLKQLAVGIKTQEIQQAKTAQETQNLQAQLKLLQNDDSIDQFEMFLNKRGLTKSDPEWQRAAVLLADKYKDASNPNGLPKNYPTMDTSADPVMQYFNQKNFNDMKRADLSPYVPFPLRKK